MERIATRVAGFIIVFIACLSITEGWNIYVRIVILLLLVLCAFISTAYSIFLHQRGVIEASSHLTILMLPIFGLVYLSRLKFLLLKGQLLEIRGIYSIQVIGLDQIEKLENKFSAWYFTIKIENKLFEIVILPSWYEELQRKFFGKPTSIDQILEESNKIKNG